MSEPAASPDDAGTEGLAEPLAEPPTKRLQDPLEYEKRFWGRGLLGVAGVDEVGRGPLAGPVVAAAVVLQEGLEIDGATDSKALTAAEREELSEQILACAQCVRLGAASVREIDRANILVATAWAMNRALGRLPKRPDHVVVDGLPMKSLRWEHEAVVGGDLLVHSVACASIVAKVCRDRLMAKLAMRYPGYGWDHNMGYGTGEHRDALERLGATPHHRQTFLGLQYSLEL
ncbi:MAG TPA: ribonuclease HII [Gemmatimonadetes bacterium]|nr:ribonuclease HII [Gemmatimonadota bacterium]